MVYRRRGGGRGKLLRLGKVVLLTVVLCGAAAKQRQPKASMSEEEMRLPVPHILV